MAVAAELGGMTSDNVDIVSIDLDTDDGKPSPGSVWYAPPPCPSPSLVRKSCVNDRRSLPVLTAWGITAMRGPFVM